MPNITKSTVFDNALVTELINKTKGRSTLAKLCEQTPQTFGGIEEMMFSLDGEVSIVAEGAPKPAGSAEFKGVIVKPVKMVYQHRVTDEFTKMSEERQANYLAAFTDGFAKKIARGLDIAAFHGIDPASKETVASLNTKNFDMSSVGSVVAVSGKEDEAIDSAIAAIEEADNYSFAFSKAFATSLSKIKVNGVVQYPEFRFGRNPGSFAGSVCDINSTVSYNNANTLAYVGDFMNNFRWGMVDNIPLEIIEYGDPDGQGDLKRNNQICLKSEAYVSWGILDASAFKKIVVTG